MENQNNVNNNEIFPKGKKISNEHFIGTVWLEMLVTEENTYNCTIGNVTFDPGARNNWHKHSEGQILLVTSGTGYYQEEGKPIQLLHAGDVVKIRPGVKHWHGAAPDSQLTHIAIQRGDAEWLERVTDEQYKSYKK